MKIITKRLVGFSDLVIENGHIQSKPINEQGSLLQLKSITGKEEAFCFYDKNDQDILVCHVGITDKREKFEVTYGTVEKFRNRGYMSEALDGFVNFVFAETNEPIIWALPNGAISQHVLEKCKFKYVCEENGIKWFARKRENDVEIG